MTTLEHKNLSDTRAGRNAIGILLVVALALRLGWCLSRPAGEAEFGGMPDQVGYLELARNLLRGEGLRYVDERFGASAVVYAVRMPGYPLFVAALGASVRAVRVAQAVIDTSTVLAVYLLARRWLPARTPRWGPLLAAGVMALNPFLVFFCALLLTETLFTAMLAWAVLLLSSRRTLFWGIVLLALSVHVRPSAVLLPVALPVLAVWATAARPGWRHQVLPATAGAATGALLLFAALLPWAWRNHNVLGRWVWSTTNDGITAYDGFNPRAAGGSDQSFTRDMPGLRQMTELERNDYFGRLAREYVRENPARAVALTLRKVARTWSPLPLSDEYATRRNVAIGLLYSLPFDVLVLIGLIRGRVGWRAALLLAAPAAYFTVIHALSVGSLRYRVPAEPLLAVLAAAGALRLVARARGMTGGSHPGTDAPGR